MKNKLILIISIMAILGLSACNSQAEAEEVNQQLSLEQQAQILIDQVIMMASSEAYMDMITVQSEMRAIIDDIAIQDYSTPQNIYQLNGLADLIITSMQLEATLEPEIEPLVKPRLTGVLPGQLNAMNGTETLAAASILNHSNSFIYEGLEEDISYLYTFDHDYSFMISFYPSQQNIVNASISIIVNEQFNSLQTTEEFMKHFEAMLGIVESETSISVEQL